MAGSIAAAHYIRAISPIYGVPVVLHTDHCAKKLLPWLDGMLDEDEAFFKKNGIPLFSSHMIDLVRYSPSAERVCILTSVVWYVIQGAHAPEEDVSRLLTTALEEPVHENIETCVKYLKRMAPMKQWLEMEIGITVRNPKYQAGRWGS